MTKAISANPAHQNQQKTAFKRIQKTFDTKVKTTTAPENPSKVRFNQKLSQKDSLRKIYQKILDELKAKPNAMLHSINEFLSFLKKNPNEVF